jgi:DNA-binding response OmpR family regulator
MPCTGPTRVLLVEDDLDVAAGIGDYLTARGLAVDFAANAREARARVGEGRYHVLVLDVNLPGQDGIALCQELKRDMGLATPAIFLTARAGLDDKLRGFAAGAIDYMVKPFEPAELLARIRAIDARMDAAGAPLLRVGHYTLDLEAGLLARGDDRLQLHAAGLAIVRRLMQAAPRAVAKQALVQSVWGDNSPDSEPLRAHVYQLRQAMIERLGEAPIETVRGIGYRFGAG